MYIYKTTNLINGKIYIGQSVQCSKESKTYLGSGIYFTAALKKYKRKNFKKEIIEEYDYYDQKLLDEREIFWIKEFNARDKEIGYNLDDGGKGHHPYLNKTKEEQQETFIKLSLASKKAWQKVLDTYSEDKLKDLYNIKRQIALDFWKSQTKQQKQEIYDKISYSLKSQSEKIAQKTKENWSNKTEEEKQQIKNKISNSLNDFWTNVSDEKRNEFSKMRSEKSKNFWDNVSEEFISNFKQTISESSKKMWENMSEETYNSAMIKKSKSMTELYKNNPEFVKLKTQKLRDAIGIKIKVTEKNSNNEYIFDSKSQAYQFLKITKGTFNSILKGENKFKNKHNKYVQQNYKIETL